jgi:sugar lactone lactonase YvrE
LSEPQVLMEGIAFGEQPRWHQGRLWFSGWGPPEVIAVDLEGNREVILRAPAFPCCVDWLPDGRLLIVSAREGRLLRQETGGSLVTHGDLSSLIVAESYGNKLTAFDIEDDGSLSNRRVWADLGDGVPDGICLDTENAVWYGDVPNKRCVCVREGGEVLQTIELDRGCAACALGGPGRRTLFMMATQWDGPESMFAEPRTGQVLAADAPAPGAGWP